MKKNIFGISYIFIIYLLVLQHFLEIYIPIFQYFDELLALMFFPIFIAYIMKNHGKIKIEKSDLKIIICIILIIILQIFMKM